MTRFGWALEDSIWLALRRAVSDVLKNPPDPKTFFPIVPIVRAGEDTVILCHRDLAFDLAQLVRPLLPQGHPR